MIRRSYPFIRKTSVFFMGFIALGALVYGLTYRPWVGLSHKTEEPKGVVESLVPSLRSTGLRPPLAIKKWGTIQVVPKPVAVQSASEEEIKGAKEKKPVSATPLASMDPEAASHHAVSSPDPPHPVKHSAKKAAQQPASAEGEANSPLTHGVMARFDAPDEEAESESDEAKELLPALPQRSEISRVMSSIRQPIQRCYDLNMVPGKVDVKLTVEGRSGRVLKSDISGESSTANCIRRLAESIRFPRFAKDQIAIHYPYYFR